MSAPKYVERIARLPRVFELLTRHPDGMPLVDLAADIGVPVEELREDLLAFYTADLGGEWLLSRPDVLEFLGPDGTTEDPGTAGTVRLVSEGVDLGVEYVDAGELGLVYTAALALLETDPDDADLGEAIDVLAETMFGAGAADEDAPPALRAWNRLLPDFRRAVAERRPVRIVYSRSWKPGVGEREIEPYRLVQTRRGWEVDAGPLDEDGALRTYLLSNVREVDLLEGTFEVPDDLDQRVARQRETTRVKVVLPQSGRWAADFYAESVTVVQDDEESVEVDLDLLPPVESRVGRLLLAAGPDAFVVEPRELEHADVILAEELLIHHTS